ncbi:hypothetical protein GEMRC1_012390 [Eukaryota sp. GEM-RC1]
MSAHLNFVSSTNKALTSSGPPTLSTSHGQSLKGKTWNNDTNVTDEAMSEFGTLLLLDKRMMLSPDARKNKSYANDQLSQINAAFDAVIRWQNSLYGNERALFTLRIIQYMIYQRSIKGVGQRSRLGFTYLFQQLYHEFPDTCIALLDLIVSKYGSFGDLNRLYAVFSKSSDLTTIHTLAKLYARHVSRDLETVLDFDITALKHFELLDLLKESLVGTTRSLSLSLAGKWLPRKGHQYNEFRFFIIDALFDTNFAINNTSSPKKFNLYEKLYRIICSCLNKHLNTCETLMCNKSFSLINPSSVPAVALTKMRKAFLNEKLKEKVPESLQEVGNRYPENLDRVTCRQKFREYILAGKVKGAAQDLQTLSRLIGSKSRGMSDLEKSLINQQWVSMRADVEQLMLKSPNGRHILPVIDVSMSMNDADVMDIAIGLGIMTSQLSTLPCHFITFSDTPTVVKYDNHDDIFRIFEIVKQSHWGYTTNIEKTTDILLKLLVSNLVPQDYVFTLMYLTDGQFNQVTQYRNTFFKRMQLRFRTAGYSLPRIVFWNLNSRSPGFPVDGKQRGVQMVSGYSQTLLQQVLSQDFTLETLKTLTPEQTLRDALESFVDVEECVLKVGEGILVGI